MRHGSESLILFFTLSSKSGKDALTMKELKLKEIKRLILKFFWEFVSPLLGICIPS